MQTCEGSCMHPHGRGGMNGREGGGMHERGGMVPYLNMGRTMWELQESALHQLAEVAEKKKLQVETKIFELLLFWKITLQCPIKRHKMYLNTFEQ